MDSFSTSLAKFFGVVARGQTYLNLVYLLLAFPLGLFYFVFLVTGLSLGISLIIIWVGLAILLGVYAAWYGLAVFERWLAIALLKEDIPPMTKQDLTGMTLWQKFVFTLKNPVTWKGLVYLFARFPLGLFSFIVVVTLGAISLALITVPAYYQWAPPHISFELGQASYTAIDTLSEALVACLIGFILAVVSLHIFNGLAWVSGKFARLMLGNFSTAPAAPAMPAAPATPAGLGTPALPEAPSAPEVPPEPGALSDTTQSSAVPNG